MPIEKIACPRLSREDQPGEVFVRFDADEKPTGVMCDKYDSDDNHCKLDNKPCTYESWESFE